MPSTPHVCRCTDRDMPNVVICCMAACVHTVTENKMGPYYVHPKSIPSTVCLWLSASCRATDEGFAAYCVPFCLLLKS